MLQLNIKTHFMQVKPLKELAFNSHSIIATMTSRQFQVMLDVLTNLLFARLPKYGYSIKIFVILFVLYCIISHAILLCHLAKKLCAPVYPSFFFLFSYFIHESCNFTFSLICLCILASDIVALLAVAWIYVRL